MAVPGQGCTDAVQDGEQVGESGQGSLDISYRLLLLRLAGAERGLSPRCFFCITFRFTFRFSVGTSTFIPFRFSVNPNAYLNLHPRLS